MELSLLLAQSILSMFLMGVVGFFVVKIGLFKEEDSKILSKVVVYILSPCVIVNSFQIDFTMSKLQGLAIAAAAAVVVHVVMIPGTSLLSKVFHFNAIEVDSIIYSNAGNLIIPLVAATLGPEWVFYSSAYLVVQTVLMWTHAIHVMCGKMESNWKGIVLNPNMIAIYIGIILFFARIPLPEVIGSAVESFSSCIGAVSMLVIGMLMGNVDLKWAFRQKRPYLIDFIRLIFFPLILAVLAKAAMLFVHHPDINNIIIIVLMAASAPPAAMITQLAQIYNKDARYGSILNLMGVSFCVVTMPLIILIFNML